MAASISTALTRAHPYACGLCIYEDIDTDDLIQALLHATKRHDVPQPAIAAAIAKLLWYREGKAHDTFYDENFENICSKDPFLALLVAPYFNTSGRQCMKFALQDLYAYVKEYHDHDQSVDLRKAAELVFRMSVLPIGKDFRGAFSHTISRSTTCLAYLSGQGVPDSELFCSLAFVKWLFSPSSMIELQSSATNGSSRDIHEKLCENNTENVYSYPERLVRCLGDLCHLCSNSNIATWET
ncbi:hypothetical protein C0995_014956 [Termitomyces sp. Mi166|nr:hypothetical protein C0995_014956 [Termitomyces sp. Mi166\